MLWCSYGLCVTSFHLLLVFFSSSVWDNPNPVESSAPHSTCTALKCTNGRMQFGTQLKLKLHDATPLQTIWCCWAKQEQQHISHPKTLANTRTHDLKERLCLTEVFLKVVSNDCILTETNCLSVFFLYLIFNFALMQNTALLKTNVRLEVGNCLLPTAHTTPALKSLFGNLCRRCFPKSPCCCLINIQK